MARSEWARTTEFIEAAVAILEEQQPMTIRQLFYALVSREVIENCDRDYKYTSRMMTKARDDGRVDYDWIVDRSRPTYEPNVWDDLQGYAESIQCGYRKDYWKLQPCYVELWCEKDSVIGSIEDVTDELGITVRVGRGFQSTTRVHEIAEHLGGISKPTHICFLGDHDPSGVDIERDIADRVNRQLWHNDSGYITLKRLAIFANDIKLFRLPPLRIKTTDTRAQGFRKTHGRNCVELDALPPDELRRRVREAVEGVMDLVAWQRAVQVEKAEIKSIVDTVSQWPGNLNVD